jgi:MarR family transcriptional regulator, organic hydroperoxide resistance regulator
VRLSLTPAGRRLIEKDLGDTLIDATGLGEEFPVVQQTVSRLRDNLLRNATGIGEAMINCAGLDRVG